MQPAILVGRPESMEPGLGLAVSDVFCNAWLIIEYLFRFGLADTVPVLALPVVALIPFKAADSLKVDHERM